MLHRVMHKVKWFFVFAVVLTALMILASQQTVRAEVVDMHHHSLGGFSLMWENYLNSGNQLYSNEDLDLLSEVMFYENYNNGEYVMKLTGSVVLNRVAHKDFPNTIREVLYQKGQYSTTPFFFKKTIPQEVKSMARELLLFGSIAPSNVIWQAMFPQGKGVWYEYNNEYFCY